MKRYSLNSVVDLKKVKVSKNRVREKGSGEVGGWGGYGREFHSSGKFSTDGSPFLDKSPTIIYQAHFFVAQFCEYYFTSL